MFPSLGQARVGQLRQQIEEGGGGYFFEGPFLILEINYSVLKPEVKYKYRCSSNNGYKLDKIYTKPLDIVETRSRIVVDSLDD